MDPLLLELSRQGVGFLLLAVMVIAYIRKDMALTDAYQKRVDDNNRLATVIEATNTASRALETTSVQRSRVIETIGETTQAMAEAMRAHATALESGKEIAVTNHASLQQISAQLHQLQRAVDKLGDDHQAAARETRNRR